MSDRVIPIVALPAASSNTSTSTTEGVARVVRIADGTLWLEPEQTSGCGSCASSSVCGTGEPGLGTVASRNAARRFRLPLPAVYPELRVGERIVVGIRQRALIKAALTAYALPLFGAIAVGGLAQYLYGSDRVSMLAMLGGLGFGLLLARGLARRLTRRGELSLHFLRRATAGDSCSPSEALS